MINAYEGVMDTNLVLPIVWIDVRWFSTTSFADISKKALKKNQASIKVSEKVQDEDEAICDACSAGSVHARMWRDASPCAAKAGEHLFHRLLHAS